MFVSVLFVSICKVLILFFVMHVFFLIILIFSYWFFISVFGSFLFSRAIYQEASNRQVFSLLLSCIFVLLLFIFICKVFLLCMFSSKLIVIFSSCGIDLNCLIWYLRLQANYSPFYYCACCFGTVCLYLQGFNFVCFYACFLLN